MPHFAFCLIWIKPDSRIALLALRQTQAALLKNRLMLKLKVNSDEALDILWPIATV